MKVWNILAIGNSFSEDAFFYLHDLCKAGNIMVNAVNLFVGGCSIRQHLTHYRGEEKVYQYQENGVALERYVSINEVLKERQWDIIMTQQASHDSGITDTYFPYLEELIHEVRKACADTAIYLHQTWAYEIDSSHEAFSRYHNSQQEMYVRSSLCYQEAAKKLELPLIESGKAVQAVRACSPFRYEMGERSLCRDGFHMELIYGRYLVAAMLYTTFFGQDIRENPFLPNQAKPEGIRVIQDCVAACTAGTSQSVCNLIQ